MSGQQQGPQDVYSMSFRTNGAVAFGEDGWTFDVQSGAARQRPTRIQLGSIELPLQQQTIEKDWQRLYFQERCVISPSNRLLEVSEQAPALEGETFSARLLLPMQYNYVSDYAWEAFASRLRITTSLEHGLWAGIRPLIRQWDSWNEQVHIVGAPFAADMNLSKALNEGRLLQGEASNVFYLVLATPPSPLPSGGGGILWCRSPPSPAHMSSVLTAALRGVGGLSPVANVTYDAVSNETVVSTVFLEDRSVKVSVVGDNLASMLGFCGGYQEKIFRRRPLDPATLGPCVAQDDFAQRALLQQTQNHDLRPHCAVFEGVGPNGSGASDPAPDLRGGSVVWPYVNLTIGWYGPVRRPMSVGSPFPIRQEWDRQLNRFLIRPRNAEDEHPLPHLVIMTTTGVMMMRPLNCGTFTPQTLASDMRAALVSMDPDITVSFEAVDTSLQLGRFVFRTFSGSTFQLIFNHGSSSIEAWRLGFDDITYEGEGVYEGAPLKLADVSYTPSVENPVMRINTYALGEDMYQSKFKLEVQAPPPLLGELITSSASTAMFVATLQSLPAAHGLVVGQGVRLCTPSKETFEVDGETLYALDVGGVFAAVIEVYTDTRRVRFAVYTGLWAIDDSRRQVVTIRVPVEPSNFNFSSAMPFSVGYERLGFEARAYQFRLDGIHTFVAPFVFNLEGPDYVLIYVADGKRNTNMIHQSLNDVSCPFAKVILYPGYREERALTREIVLSSGEDFSRFTIAVRNPDGSAYQMNGAVWSFTLNFVIQG